MRPAPTGPAAQAGRARCRPSCSTWTACWLTPSRSGSRPRARSWPGSAVRGARRTSGRCWVARCPAPSPICWPGWPGLRSPSDVARWLVDGMTALLAARGPQVLPGAAELLTEVRADGVSHALVTSSERQIMDAVIAHAGLGLMPPSAPRTCGRASRTRSLTCAPRRRSALIPGTAWRWRIHRTASRRPRRPVAGGRRAEPGADPGPPRPGGGQLADRGGPADAACDRGGRLSSGARGSRGYQG